MNQSYSFELPNKTKQAERKAYVTIEGKGILAGIIHNRESKKDTIILDEIREFKLISTRQYDYPKYLTLFDINLFLDELGNGKIFFEDVICSNQLCNSTFFELGKDPLQVSYVSLRNFALQ